MIHSNPSQFLKRGNSVTEPVEAANLALPALHRATAEASEAKRLFGSLLKSLPGLFYRCEPKSPWKISFISDGVEDLTGYVAEEIVQKSGWAAIMLPQDRAAVKDAVAAAIAEHRSYNLTYRLVRAGGEVVWVGEVGHAIYGDDGAISCLEGVISDVSGRKQAEELQRTMLLRWRKTLDLIPQMVWTVAGDGSDEFYNAKWADFVGRALGGGRACTRLELVHPDDRDRAEDLWRSSFASGDAYEAQYRLYHRSGEYRWVLSRSHAELDDEGRAVRWYGTCTDIHEHVLAKEALEASETLNRSVIEATPDCISLLDPHGAIRFANASAVAALNLKTDATIIGRSWRDTFPVGARGPAAIALGQAQAGRPGHFSTAQSVGGATKWWDIVLTPIRPRGEDQTGILAIARDVTQQKTAEEKIRWAGNHDPLTQLPNRTLFQRALDQQLGEAADVGGTFSVLMMDLDDFKRTNDALGHDAGDALLSEFAHRLRGAVRSDDVIARLGGDEFAVVLHGVGDEDGIEEAVAAIRNALRAPFLFEGKMLDIKVSIGASLYPNQGATRGELLKHADIALYAAKAAGRGVLRVFRPAMRAEAQHRLSMLSLAKDALACDRIVPFYQPKVDLRSGAIDGFEALLRWEHPVRGIQTPDTIAAAFEDVTLAAEISDQMIGLVVEDMRLWTDLGVEFGHVAVNAAAAEFKRGDFAERLLERLHRASLPTSCFQLEITETVFLGRGAEHVETALKTLSRAGVRIALDDFGTGYASLSHLNHFPVDVIKIDRSFISKLEGSTHDAAIVRAVINLGRSLGIKIVAEGVETSAQAAYLRKHRCHSGQGYLFGKARPADYVTGLSSNLNLAA